VRLEFLPIVIVVIAALAYFFYSQEKKRREVLRAWARRQGWRFDKDKRKGWDRDFPGLKIFDKGHSRHGKYVISGKFRGREVLCFDYQYTTGSGKNQQTHLHSVTILRLDHPVIPLQIRREHMFDKVGEFLGADDIDFESVEFSKTFYVTSPDRKWAYDVLHTRAMEFLLGAPKHFSIAFGHNEIAICKSGRAAPAHYEEGVKLAHELVEMIPDYVMQQLKGT
jgi:hypothetical protein